MGHKKKIHNLPPLGNSKNKGGRRNSRSQSQGCLGVAVPDRQRLIGSPAPQALRRGDRQHKLKKNGSMSEFPTITLSACEDDEDDWRLWS